MKQLKETVGRFLGAILLLVLVENASSLGDILPTSSKGTTDGTELKLESSNQEFAAKIYSQVAEGSEKNTVISPLSIYTALAMLRTGSRKKCKKQLDNALGLSKVRDVDKFLGDLSRNLQGASSNLDIANKAWLQRWFCFTQCRKFVRQIKNLFDTELGEVNFYGDTERAVHTINRWAYNKSRGRIENLVPKDRVNWNTRLILTNVLFFKNGWKQMFYPEYTRQAPFLTLGGREHVHKEVTTMFNIGMFRMVSDHGAALEAIELPYQDNNFAMTVIMPTSTSVFGVVERSMNTGLINRVTKSLRAQPEQEVLISMPKFNISVGFELNAVFQAMGVTDIFLHDRADLSGILGYKGLFVSDIRHEAVLSVDERGTEAAGGSSVSSGDLTVSEFRINKPFIFFIRHEPTDSIVFIGKVTDPTL